MKRGDLVSYVWVTPEGSIEKLFLVTKVEVISEEKMISLLSVIELGSSRSNHFLNYEVNIVQES